MMGRSAVVSEENGVKKGPWTPEEDEKLMDYIQRHGHGSWRALPKLAGLNRCGKSCRLRWTNYLRPDIKRGKFSQDEEQLIINLHSVLGNKYVFLIYFLSQIKRLYYSTPNVSIYHKKRVVHKVTRKYNNNKTIDEQLNIAISYFFSYTKSNV